MKCLRIDSAFISSRSINDWSGPVNDTLYLQHVNEETFTVGAVEGTLWTFCINDQPRGTQYYLRERVYGVIQIELHALTALLDVPEWSRKVVRRPRVWRWLREQQEDVQEVLEAASYACNAYSDRRARVRMPYIKLLRAEPHLRILGVVTDD